MPYHLAKHPPVYMQPDSRLDSLTVVDENQGNPHPSQGGHTIGQGEFGLRSGEFHALSSAEVYNS